MELYLDPQRMGYKGLTSEARFWAKVTKTESCWEWQSAKLANGYGVFTIHPKTVKAHRLSYIWAKGEIPEGMQVDHKCHNPACVRPDHLRLVTNKQNQENVRGAQRNSRSGFRGVCWDKLRRKWAVSVAHRGQRIYVGHFADIEEANAAAVAKRNELYTHNDADRIAA